jgi:hypothetical protein
MCNKLIDTIVDSPDKDGAVYPHETRMRLKECLKLLVPKPEIQLDDNVSKKSSVLTFQKLNSTTPMNADLLAKLSRSDNPLDREDAILLKKAQRLELNADNMLFPPNPGRQWSDIKINPRPLIDFNQSSTNVFNTQAKAEEMRVIESTDPEENKVGGKRSSTVKKSGRNMSMRKYWQGQRRKPSRSFTKKHRMRH